MSTMVTKSAGNEGGAWSYLPGLDGLRAIAVIAVLIYHAEVTWFRGGFLGVEVFFVISGYLITSLLLAEWRRVGHIDLKGFWLRRARRLLPAVFVLLLGTLGFAVAFLPKEVAGLRGDTIAAMGYFSNWYLIFSKQSYFDAVGRPSLLRHLWSLAVEEQFYLCWPLLLTLGLRIKRGRFLLPAVLLGAVASAVAMGLLYNPETDPSRVYYGTDTRAAGLLIGAALAFIWNPGRLQESKTPAWLLDAVGFAALGNLALYCIFFHEYLPFLYQGGFALVALTTAAVIATSVHPRARFLPAALGLAPLRWIGQRSYGIYLWHWPVFMITRPQLDVALEGLPLLALRLALTGILAELSYRFVEMPIRTGALGRAWKKLEDAHGRRRWWLGFRWGGAVTGVLVAVLALGISVAGAQPPPPPEYLAVTSFQGVISAHTPTPLPTPTAEEVVVSVFPSDATPIPPPAPTLAAPPAGTIASPTPAPTQAEPSASMPTHVLPAPTMERMRDPTRPALPTPTVAPAELTPPPAPIISTYIMAVGDSVMLGATRQMAEVIGELVIDAAISRQVDSVIGLVRARREAGQLPDVLIVHVGNNGLFTAKKFDEMMRETASVRRVIIVNLKVPRPWQDTNNAVLAEGVKRYPNATLVDWYGETCNHPELFWDDGMHLRPEGARLYAQLIVGHLGLPPHATGAAPPAGMNPQTPALKH